jgi:hypothetical protein
MPLLFTDVQTIPLSLKRITVAVKTWQVWCTQYLHRDSENLSHT